LNNEPPLMGKEHEIDLYSVFYNVMIEAF
jgi:hypothetical protein